MKLAGKAFAAEGVTLSGALLGEDCRWIELWRIPQYIKYTVGCRRGKVQNSTNLSGKRTKRLFLFLRGFAVLCFMLLRIVPLHGLYFLF